MCQTVAVEARVSHSPACQVLEALETECLTLNAVCTSTVLKQSQRFQIRSTDAVSYPLILCLHVSVSIFFHLFIYFCFV